MRKFPGKYLLFLQMLACFAAVGAAAQVPVQPGNLPPASVLDSIRNRPPGLSPLSPSLDTISPTAASRTDAAAGRDSLVVDLSKVQISNDGLDDVVEYGARDSMWFDVASKQVHLYGEAFMKYTSIDLKAGYILLDYSLNMVTARGFADSSGTLAGAPQFKDGEQSFSARELKYNFKSKKGIIYEAYTQQEDLYVLGTKAKFVGAKDDGDTSKTSRNTVYNYDAILTTCNHPQPHFGIRTKKLKVIPDKLVVTGFSNVEIGGVPTPLVLPFGFYPITKTKKSGLIIPRDFDFSDQWGFGLRNVGYYIPISDHMDLTLNTDIYFQGTFRLGADLNYLKRYKYRGNFSAEFNNRVGEDSKARRTSDKSIGLRWSHNQDSKAHPTRNFGGNLNIQTNQNQNRNRNDYQSVYQNSLSSNLSYRQTFPGKPFNLTASMSHSQNTSNRQMNITLPNVNFTMQQIYPLRRKKRVGKERWYEQISLNYTSQLQNSIVATDTTLFTRETLNKSRMGIQHRASSSLPLKILKYITVNPNINYEENWYPYTVEHQLLNRTTLVRDTQVIQGEQFITIDSAASKFGKDTLVRNWGFHAFRNYNAGVSLNTALFFTKQLKKGWFRGVRHTVKPSVSFGLGPDFSNPKYGYFKQYYTSQLPQYADTLTYGIYDDAIFGRPSNSRRQLAVSYGFINLLEMKFRSRRDTLTGVKKVKIFDNLAFRGTYSLTADSLKWSTVSTGGVFRFFKGVVGANWSAEFDPYIADAKGRRINKFAWKEGGKLVRLTNLNLTINTAVTLSQIRSIFEKKEDGNAASPAPGKDDFGSWFDRFRVSHNINFARRLLAGGGDTLLITYHGLGITGDIPLTPKWSFNVGNISYDFPSKRLVYPDIGITRDLHCWQMSFSWQPERGTYNFFINVKPGTLDFLKVPYRKNNADGRFSF